MTRHHAWLLVYLAAVVVATVVHDLAVLAIMFAVAILLAGRALPRIAARLLRSVVVFNAVVTASYVVVSLWRGEFSPRFVVLMNLRVFLLTFLTLLVGERVNPFIALSFSRSLTYLLTVSYSQVLTFRRLFDDFRLALKSRTIARVTARDRYRHAAASTSFFVRKSVHDATEVTQAMNSRGFFDA